MDCCLFTRGEVFIRDAVMDCPGGIMDILCDGGLFKKVGNVESLRVLIDGEVLGTENQFNPALPESRVEVRGVNLELIITCASAENLRRALLSEAKAKDSGVHIDSAPLCEDIEEGDFIPFTKYGASNVEVNLIYNGNPTALVEGVDYSVEESGIRFIRDIAKGSNVEVRVRYDYDENKDEFEFLTTHGKYKEVFFKGLNYGEDGGIFDARFYRVLFGTLNEADLITKDSVLAINLIGSVSMVDGKWFKFTKG